MHVDQVENISFPLKPSESEMEFFPDIGEPEFVRYERAPHQMGRIINVEQIGGIILNPYMHKNKIETPDLKLEIHVRDDLCSWNNGTFCFKMEKGKLIVKRMQRKLDEAFDLNIRGLSGLIYGAVEDLSELTARGWLQQVDEKKIEIIKTMFPYQLPFVCEVF